MKRVNNPDSPEKKIKDLFSFLINDYGYIISKEKNSNYGTYYIYEGNDIRVVLNYDYKDNFFYFKLVKGHATPYPNDNDSQNIKPFYKLIQKYDPSFNPRNIQPNEEQYEVALELNATLLKKYGDKVLKGEEWV